MEKKKWHIVVVRRLAVAVTGALLAAAVDLGLVGPGQVDGVGRLLDGVLRTLFGL